MHDPAGELEFTTLAGELQRLGNNAVLEDPRTNYYQYAVALAGNRRPTPTGSQHMQYLRQTVSPKFITNPCRVKLTIHQFSGAFLALNAPSAVQTPVAALLQLPVDALTLNCTSTRLRSQGNASSSTAATTPIQATSSASAFDATQATTPANFRSTTRESTRAGAAAPVIHSTAVTQAIGSQASQAGDQSAKAIDLRHGAPIVLDLETGLEVFRCVRCRGMKPISDFPGYSNHKKGYPRSCNRCYAYKKHKKPKQEKKESDSEDNIFHIPSHEPGTKRRRDPSDDEGEDDRHRGDGAGNRMMSGSRDRGIAV